MRSVRAWSQDEANGGPTQVTLHRQEPQHVARKQPAGPCCPDRCVPAARHVRALLVVLASALVLMIGRGAGRRALAGGPGPARRQAANDPPLQPTDVRIDPAGRGVRSGRRRARGKPKRILHVSPRGSDGASGSEDRPWRTLTGAATKVKAGDLVLVHAGEYAGLRVQYRRGSWDHPIVFKAAPGEKAIISGAVRVAKRRYVVAIVYTPHIIIEGFRIVAKSGHVAAVWAYLSRGIVMRNNVIAGNPHGDAVVLERSPFAVFERNEVRCGRGPSRLLAVEENTAVRFNLFEGGRGDQVQCVPGSYGAVIEFNEFRSPTAPGGCAIAFRDASCGVVRYNTIHHARYGRKGALHAKDSRCVVFTHNTIHKVRDRAFSWYGACEGILFTGNLVAETRAGRPRDPGTYNFIGMPRFVDAGAGDLRPRAGSPAIDAADPRDPVPEGGGRRADIGAYEASAPRKPTEAYDFQAARKTPSPTPTFTWKHNDPEGDRQAAFECQIDTTYVFHGPGMIDSEVQETGRPAWTVSSRAALEPGKYYFRVRTRDHGAQAFGPWSDPVRFEVKSRRR